MKRRTFLRLVASLWAIRAVPALAQERITKRIGWLTTAPHPFLQAFRNGLSIAGYIEGKDVQIIETYADAHADRLMAAARSFSDHAVDIVVASGSAAAQASRREIKGTPVVFVTSDPVALGLVQSLAHPGSNVTGFDLAFDEVASKWVEFMLELLPAARRFAVVATNEQSALSQADAVATTAARLGKQTFVVMADDLDFARHLEDIHRQGADAAMVTSTPTLDPGLATLIAAANAHRLPVLYQNRDWTRAGGLISYGPDLAVVFQRAALAVDRILRGQDPASIPVERPTRFQLVINLKTAKMLELAVPPSLLARADEVIE